MNSSRRGSALLTVLWLSAGLAAIGVAVASNVRGETERVATSVDDLKAYFLARAAIDRAILHVFWGPDYYVPGTPTLQLDFQGGVVRVEMIPENARLNVNRASEEDLARLLAALGVPGERATALIGAIMSRRTEGAPLGGPPPGGATGPLGQSSTFSPRVTSFQEMEELLRLPGMTDDLYYGAALATRGTALRDCLSTWSIADPVSINSATRATLIAIGMDPASATSLVAMTATRPLSSGDLASMAPGLGLAGRRVTTFTQTTMEIRATARLRGQDGKLSDLQRTIAAEVKFWLPGNRQQKQTGYEIVRWFDRA